MSTKRFLRRKSTAAKPLTPEAVSEVAIAGVISSQKQNEVLDFINFVTDALARNSIFINKLVEKNPSFKCAVITGSGPDCFKVKNIVYPSGEELKLEIELLDCEDYDKIGVAALVRITPTELNSLLGFVKYSLRENFTLQEDLLKGKNIGVSFMVLQPFVDGQFKVTEKLALDSSHSLTRKRKNKNSEKILSPIKKIRQVI